MSGKYADDEGRMLPRREEERYEDEDDKMLRQERLLNLATAFGVNLFQSAEGIPPAALARRAFDYAEEMLNELDRRSRGET